MTHSTDHQMTEIYSFVDDFLHARPHLQGWRHSPHARPRFSDAEVLTSALLQAVFCVASLKQTYRLVARNWGCAFPHLPGYTQWINLVRTLGDAASIKLDISREHQRQAGS